MVVILSLLTMWRHPAEFFTVLRDNPYLAMVQGVLVEEGIIPDPDLKQSSGPFVFATPLVALAAMEYIEENGFREGPKLNQLKTVDDLSGWHVLVEEDLRGTFEESIDCLRDNLRVWIKFRYIFAVEV